MPTAYRQLLATPGAKAFVLAGFVMRMPISMATLGIVLLLSATRGSYGLAGAVSAVYVLVQAAAQPQVARLVDRVGQARVIVAALAAHAVGLVALVVAAALHAPPWTLFAAVALAGATFVPVGSLVRARWAHVLRGSALLHTAYSLESVVDELIFIVGPIIVTVLAARVAPAAGLLAALAFLVVGTLALAAQRSSEPPPQGDQHGGRPASAIRAPGVRVLAVVFAAVGSVFGSVEVTTVAFAAERGRPAATALILALFALGSLLAGVAYGTIRWRAPLPRRFLVAVSGLGAAVAVFPLIDDVAVLAAAAFVSGFAISPTIIAGYALIEELVAPDALTEGLTWATTGMGVGLAIGTSAVGQVIDAAGAQTAFLVTLASGVTAAALAFAGARWLRAPARPAVAAVT